MRASRLLSLLLLLQTRGRMTAPQLADELEVSVRTVYRDVESLSAAGVPVYADRGPTGGYRLLDGYRTRLTGLSSEEADSLFLAGIPGPAAELGLGSVVAAAQLKLLAALPPELRSRAVRIRERFHLDAPTWYSRQEPTPHLAAVADAVWNQRRVEISYQRANPREDPVTRTLEPLGLVLKAGIWYLAARCAGQDRTYRVSRVRELAALDERFERPDGWDLADFWRAWSELFHANLYCGEAVVRLTAHGLERAAVLLLPAEARAARESAGPPDAQGWRRAVIPFESIEHGRVAMLRLGADVEVLEPPELRRRMAETAEALARLYAL